MSFFDRMSVVQVFNGLKNSIIQFVDRLVSHFFHYLHKCTIIPWFHIRFVCVIRNQHKL